MPCPILSSCVRFHHLDFYGNTRNTGVNEHYRQSSASVRIDVGNDQGRFQLFNVEPRSTPKQDTKVKQVETNERTRQHQVDLSTNFTILPWKSSFGGKYGNTTARKYATTEESSVNINRIIQTKTGRNTSWYYFVDDEWVKENGLRGLAPTASFSFLGPMKPNKLRIEVESTWTMPDAGLWDRYTRFVRNVIPIRNLATRISFDMPPHMTKPWTVFRDMNIRIIPRDKSFGFKLQIESDDIYGDKAGAQDFQAFISPQMMENRNYFFLAQTRKDTEG